MQNRSITLHTYVYFLYRLRKMQNRSKLTGTGKQFIRPVFATTHNQHIFYTSENFFKKLP